MSSWTQLIPFLVLLSTTFQVQSNDFEGSFGEYVTNTFIDGQFGDSFISELLAAKITFNEPYMETLGNIEKRSIREDFTPIKRRPSGDFPIYRNESGSIWQPLKGYPTPVYVKKPIKSGNHSYKVVYNHRTPIKPLGVQSKPLKRNNVAPVYNKATAKNDIQKAEERDYSNQNITTYTKKKLPKFLLPFPFGLSTKDPIRPFPTGSIFTVIPAFVIPFVPFGIFELRLPIAWSINYLVERFNGYDDGTITQGKSQSRSFAQQQLDMYSMFEDLLSNTMGMNGKACVQRLICELAEAPVDERSLMGEILHRIIDPRRDSYEVTNDYMAAEEQGRQFGGCFAKYGSCPLTIRRLLPDNYVEMMKRRKK